MSQALQTYSLTAPGFQGLNTQESPLDLSLGFALVAQNAIIDQYGRIGSRKGYSKVNSSSGALGANDVTVIHELVQADGTLTVLFTGNNTLFKLDGSNAVVELTYGGGGTAPTITASNWQAASLNNITYFFQSGFNPLIYDPAISTTTFRRVSEKTGYVGTVPDANIAISAFGRLWVATSTTNNSTVFFSDLIAGHVWSTGTSGSLNVDRVWINGADEITGLAAHNGFLFIFGKRQILIYQNATTPASMQLSDTVEGIGCIARDSIQTTSTDVLFLSNSGVRSLMRTVQEKSSPERDLSKNVRNDLMSAVSAETASNIKAIYSETNALYLLNLPASKYVYAFDTKGIMQDGSSRSTIWDSIEPTSFCAKRNGDLLIGKNGYIGKYGTYLDDATSYRLAYYTNNSDLGDVNVTSILKKIKVIVVGGSNQLVTLKWGYDFTGNYYSQQVNIPTQTTAEYGIAEYGSNATIVAYYTSGIALTTIETNASSKGKIVQIGVEMDINNSPLSIQKIELQAKNGNIA